MIFCVPVWLWYKGKSVWSWGFSKDTHYYYAVTDLNFPQAIILIKQTLADPNCLIETQNYGTIETCPVNKNNRIKLLLFQMLDGQLDM